MSRIFASRLGYPNTNLSTNYLTLTIPRPRDNLGRGFPPHPSLKCDTNPLTQSKHLYYIHSPGPTRRPYSRKGPTPMSRTSLHRPRLPEWYGTARPQARPLHLPLSTHRPPTPPARAALSAAINHPPPVHVTGYGPDGIVKCQVRAAHHHPPPSRAAHERRQVAPGPSCPETPPSLPSERPCHTAAAESPRPHISVWPGTSGGRDCPTPRLPRVSFTSSQKHGAVAEPAPMWNIRGRGHHPSVQASPSSCATVRDLPSPPPSSPLSTSPVGTTGQSPSVWVPRMGRTHPSPPPKKGTTHQPTPTHPSPTTEPQPSFVARPNVW